MCHVFRARRRGETQDCALKVLKDELRADERIVNLFLTEADIALLLDHPNLISTYDAGEINGTHFLAMEFVDGTDLQQVVRTSGPLDVANACKTVKQAAMALMAAAQIDFLVPVACVLGTLLAAATVVALRFLRQPVASRAKLIETLSGIWTLLLYLSLGAVPLLWRVWESSRRG